MKARRAARVVVGALACALLAIAVFVATNWSRALDVWHWLRTGYDFEWMPEWTIPAADFGHHPMNETGQAAVDVWEGEDEHAALWSVRDPQVQSLGALPDCEPLSSPCAINDRGNIVGVVKERFGIGVNPARAFFWSVATGMIEIPLRDLQAPQGVAVNDRDQVVGTASKGGKSVPFTWNPGSQVHVLEVPAGSLHCSAVDINDGGWIAGHVQTSSRDVHPVLWRPGVQPLEIGAPPGSMYCRALCLNEKGQLLVSSQPKAAAGAGIAIHPLFLWSEAEGYVELPLPGGCENNITVALNDLGHVLLSAKRAGSLAYDNFLIVDGQLKPLPPARIGAATRYTGLNNRGWLTGVVELESPGQALRTPRGFVARR